MKKRIDENIDDRYDDLPADEGWDDDGTEDNGSGDEIDDISDQDDAWQDDEGDGAENEGGGGGRRHLPGLRMLLFLAIIAVVAIAGIRLYIWNNGVKYTVDPSEASKYDTEAMDNFVPLSDTLKGSHKYDDTTTILCLGNSPFSDNAANGLAEQITAAVTPTDKKVTVINAAFPDSTVAQKNGNFDEAAYPQDVYALPFITDAICSQNYDQLSKVTKDTRAGDTTTLAALKALQSTDMSQVDDICIFYDASDYYEQRVGTNPGDAMERCSTSGALRTAITELQTKYPYIRIIVMSPYYMQKNGDNGKPVDPAVTDLGNGNLAHYVELEAGVSNDMSVSIVDNYYGSITPDNYTSYFGNDGKLNAKAYELLGKRFAEALEAGK